MFGKMQRCEKKGYVRVIGGTWNIWAITAPQFHSITISLPPFITLSLSFFLPPLYLLLLFLFLFLFLFFFLSISSSFSFSSSLSPSLPLYLLLFLSISLSFSSSLSPYLSLFLLNFIFVLHKILSFSLFLPFSSFHFFFLQLYFVGYWWLMTLSGQNPWIYILIKSSLLLFNSISHNFSSSSSSSSSSYSFLLSSVFI